MEDYENSLCSPEPVAESLGANSLDGEPSAPSKLNPTPQAFLSPDKMTVFSRLSRFGMTFAPLTENRGEDLLTWFQGDFLAKTYPPQEKEPELTESEAGCGEKWQGSFAKFDPATHSWKTHQLSLLGDWEPFSETWPRWGMMQDGACWEVLTLEPQAYANESGFLPTVCASETRDISRASVLAKLDKGGRVARRLCSRLIPNDQEIVGLNPCFAEWMQGWPVGWTALEQLATDSIAEPLLSHGRL